MLNILYICLHSVIYSSSFFFAKLPDAYAFFESNSRCYPSSTFFLLGFVWQAAVSFR